jgi:phosphonate transport system ATP-binding protein
VGIARALMQQPSLLLADEPTSSLDPKTSVEIMQLLREQGLKHGIPVVVNMHDVELARRFADRIVGMTGGKVVFDGPPADLSDAVLQQIYGGTGWMA